LEKYYSAQASRTFCATGAPAMDYRDGSYKCVREGFEPVRALATSCHA